MHVYYCMENIYNYNINTFQQINILSIHRVSQSELSRCSDLLSQCMSSFLVWLSCTSSRAKDKYSKYSLILYQILIPQSMSDCWFPWQRSHPPVRELLPRVRKIRTLWECAHSLPARKDRTPRNPWSPCCWHDSLPHILHRCDWQNFPIYSF